jgi:putative ABC transport system ATP-binding protein
MIALRQVTKHYQTEAGAFTALKGINLHVAAGEFVAIIGKSGSGKSTLLNMITGIDRPTSGEVRVGNTRVDTLSEGALARWRGRNVGIVFQFFQLIPTLSAVENVMLPMDFAGTFRYGERRDRAMHLLELVGLADQAHKLPAALSGGQQQRVAIARSLANDPPLIVADEPTGNLDSKTAESVFGLFASLVAAGKTILLVTHDTEQARRVDRAVLIADGEIRDEVVNRRRRAQ